LHRWSTKYTNAYTKAKDESEEKGRSNEKGRISESIYGIIIQNQPNNIKINQKT